MDADARQQRSFDAPGEPNGSPEQFAQLRIDLLPQCRRRFMRGGNVDDCDAITMQSQALAKRGTCGLRLLLQVGQEQVGDRGLQLRRREAPEEGGARMVFYIPLGERALEGESESLPSAGANP